MREDGEQRLTDGIKVGLAGGFAWYLVHLQRQDDIKIQQENNSNRRMSKFPSLPKTHKKLILKEKLEASLQENQSLVRDQNKEKSKIKNRMISSMSEKKHFSRPQSSKKMTTQVRNNFNIQKYSPSSDKIDQLQKVKRQLYKWVNHFYALFPNVESLLQNKQKVVSLLEDAEREGLQLRNMCGVDEDEGRSNLKQRNTTTEKSYRQIECELELVYQKNLLAGQQQRQKSHSSICSSQIKSENQEEGTLKKTGSIIGNKASSIHNKPNRNKKPLDGNYMLPPKIREANNDQIIINILKEKGQANVGIGINQESTDQNRFEFISQEKCQKYFQNGQIQNLLRIAKNFKSMKSKIFQFSKTHVFQSMQWEIDNIPYISEEILNQLNQLLELFPFQSNSKEGKQVRSQFTQYIQRISHIYQSVINKLVDSNGEKQIYVRSMEVVIKEFFQSSKMKAQILHKLKQQYINLKSLIYFIFQQFQKDIQSEKQNVSIKYIQKDKNELQRQTRKSSKVINKMHRNLTKSKTVKFNSALDVQGKALPKSINTFEITQSKVISKSKIEDIRQLRLYSQTAEHIYLASISID